MVKFIVTGPRRSGTTYTASILNTQDKVFCLEEYPWKFYSREPRTIERFNLICSGVEAEYKLRGIKPPNLREIKSWDEILDLHIKHLKDTFDSNHIGFKKTELSRKEIKMRINEGYKVILLKRDTSEILNSKLNRICSNIEKAACDLKNYYKSINYYNLDIRSNDLMILEYSKLKDSTDLVFNDLTNFLGFKVSKKDEYFQSFNKNRLTFFHNSSFPKNKHDKQFSSNLIRKYKDSEIINCANKIDDPKNLSIRYEVLAFIYSIALKFKYLLID